MNHEVAPLSAPTTKDQEAWALAELATLGEHLGGPAWVQGPGGNCSVKIGDQLWVKASGTRLTTMATAAGHARVDRGLAVAALRGDEFARTKLFASDPRPSLETYFHALGPRVVAHTHPVGVLLLACCTDSARSDFPGPLVHVPYVRPGGRLAEAVEAALLRANQPEELVLILQSHGLLVYAPSATRAVELSVSTDVEVRRWAQKFGPLPSFEALGRTYCATKPTLVQGGVYRQLPPQSVGVSLCRYLFPDAAVYSTVIAVDEWGEDDAVIAERALTALGRSCILVGPDGRRVAAAKSELQLQFACEVAACHDWARDILEPHGAARYLDADEALEICNLPSEQFRLRSTASA